MRGTAKLGKRLKVEVEMLLAWTLHGNPAPGWNVTTMAWVDLTMSVHIPSSPLSQSPSLTIAFGTRYTKGAHSLRHHTNLSFSVCAC